MKNKISLKILKKIPSNKILKIWVRWLNDKKVSKFSSRGSKKHTLKSQRNFIKEKISNKENKLFLIKFNGDCVGVIEILNIDFFNKNCEIRYLVGETKHWNKGIAAKSINLVTKYAFKKIKLKMVFADTHEDNIGSQKVLKKNRFKQQGRVKKFFNSQKKSKAKIIFSKVRK
ncbi:MAG: GNAT family N-acetyltransferase [Pelagibacteraceae bacterium]